MKPLALRELYEYAPVERSYDTVEVEVPETLYTKLCATRAAYIATCDEIDQWRLEQERMKV